MCLIHVVRGEDSRLLQQRTGFQRTALHIENMHRSARRQSQLLRGNIRQQPVPFAVFSVPQNCRVRCAFPQVFRRGAEIFRLGTFGEGEDGVTIVSLE